MVASASCRQAADELTYWIVLAIIVPAFVNLIIIGLFVWIFFMIKSFKRIGAEIASSTHWLNRTTIKVGIGPTAKKALLEYARTKPELEKLVATPGK